MEQPARRIAIFDLDGTLTWRDSLGQFLGGYLSRHPRRWTGALHLPAALGAFVLDRDRGRLKQRLIQMFLGGERREPLMAWVEQFALRVVGMGCRPQALAVLARHRRAGDYLVLLSASPDLYVEQVGRLLRCQRTICTAIAWDGDYLDGRLLTANRRGAEKLRCLLSLREEFPDAHITAYANSASDFDHLIAADERVLVNAPSRLRRRARQLGVASEVWN